MTAEHHWTASDGTRLFYRVDDFTDPWTRAPTVLLLHPGMGSSQRLFGWVPHLARHYRVVRPDTRGHGRSEPGDLGTLSHDRLCANRACTNRARSRKGDGIARAFRVRVSPYRSTDRTRGAR